MVCDHKDEECRRGDISTLCAGECAQVVGSWTLPHCGAIGYTRCQRHRTHAKKSKPQRLLGEMREMDFPGLGGWLGRLELNGVPKREDLLQFTSLVTLEA